MVKEQLQNENAKTFVTDNFSQTESKISCLVFVMRELLRLMGDTMWLYKRVEKLALLPTKQNTGF